MHRKKYVCHDMMLYPNKKIKTSQKDWNNADIFINSLDPDQAHQNIGLDLDPYHLTLNRDDR